MAMEFLFSSSRDILKKIRISDYMTILVSLIASTGLLYILLTLFFKVRRKFSVSVNCWFCCKDTKVPYDLYNKWNCPACKQYNGFDKNGDYNKVIKEQYNANLNMCAFATGDGIRSGKKLIPSNGFCKLCNINQQLKIQQLALFVPIDENNYDEEVEEYKKKLEVAYKLCPNCDKIVQSTLKKQEHFYLQNNINSKQQIPNAKKSDLWNSCVFKKEEILTYWTSGFLKGTKLVLLLSYSFLLILSLLSKLDVGNQYSNLILESLFLENSQPTFKVLEYAMTKIYDSRRETSFLAFLLQLLFSMKQQNEKETINVFSWGLLHISFWANFTELQIVMCLISLFLTIKKSYLKKIYMPKKTFLRKSSLRSSNLRDIFNECENSEDETSTKSLFFTPVKDNLISEKNQCENWETTRANEKPNSPSFVNFLPRTKDGKKKKNSKNEEECPVNKDETTLGDVDGVKDGFHDLSSSGSSKPFKPGTNENEKESSPGLNEVYNDLNGLSLGRRQNKNKKSSNFLFANHNFGERKPSYSSPIIKPAKFIKNLSNSWTGHESNESISRSSTPSTGYSSQKPDHHFDYPKTVTPISVNPFFRREYFDYFDGSSHGNRVYNFTPCCPYDFVPFQGQYPGPVGHAAVYTYTRPANSPFSFSPPRFPSSPHFHSPSSITSDSSDSENLFQNTSKNLETAKNHCRIQTLSYYLSLSLNFLTLFSLVYLFSTGIVSVEWNLPTINFFS